MSFTTTEERNWICKHFDEMMQTDLTEARKQYILDHPLLLSLITIPVITENRGHDPNIINVFDYLDELRKGYWSNPSTYPNGYGPIEKIVNQWRDGNLEYTTAKEKVKKVSCAGFLSPVYIKALMYQWIDDLAIDLDFTMKSAELAVDAVIANPLPSLSIDLMMQASEGFMQLAHRSLVRRPDGTIFTRAIKLGQWAVKEANNKKQSVLEGAFLHMLGTLSLDAYSGNFGPTEDYPENVDIWIARAKNPMPAPQEGFKLAKIFLEAALPLRTSGSAYGETVKALIEAIIYESIYMDRQPNIEALKQLSLVAMQHLDPIEDVALRDRISDLMSIYS